MSNFITLQKLGEEKEPRTAAHARNRCDLRGEVSTVFNAPLKYIYVYIYPINSKREKGGKTLKK